MEHQRQSMDAPTLTKKGSERLPNIRANNAEEYHVSGYLQRRVTMWAIFADCFALPVLCTVQSDGQFPQQQVDNWSAQRKRWWKASASAPWLSTVTRVSLEMRTKRLQSSITHFPWPLIVVVDKMGIPVAEAELSMTMLIAQCNFGHCVADCTCIVAMRFLCRPCQIGIKHWMDSCVCQTRVVRSFVSASPRINPLHLHC